MLRHPPDILITTPESLYLMLTSQARELFAGTQWVIVDEIHAVAQTKRGAHLAVTLERLAAGRPAATCSASASRPRSGRSTRWRASSSAPAATAPSSTPACASRSTCASTCRSSPWSSPTRRCELDAIPGGEATRRSIWPAIYPELLRLVREHRSTLVFVNNRRAAERIALRLNDLAGRRRRRGRCARSPAPTTARWRARSGCVIEDQLKAGTLPCLVATSSLELGIDMGAVDLVRAGRVAQVGDARPAAHRPRRARRGRGVARAASSPSSAPTCSSAPWWRGACARGSSRRPSCRATRSTCWRSRSSPSPRRAGERGRGGRRAARAGPAHLDVRRPRAPPARERARHARRPLSVAGVRRAAAADRLGPRRRHDPRPLRRPRSWPSPTPARSPTAVCSASTCRTAAASASWTRRWSTRRAPARPSCSAPPRWRIEEITRDRVVVTPAPGAPGAVPFWHGDGVGRPRELGEAIGAFSRWAVRPGRGGAAARLRPRRARRHATCSRSCASSRRRRGVVPSRPHASSSSASATRSATGGCACSSPYGGRVHAAWALALSARIRDALRARGRRHLVRRRHHRPPARRRRAAGRRAGAGRARTRPRTWWSPSSAPAPCSAPASARTRPARCSSRAPTPGRRTPLWQQRLKAQSLLEVARALPAVPGDPRDLPRVPARRARRARARRAAAHAARRARSSLVEVETQTASPFASLAALRLRRHLHVRGRHARRRAPRGRRSRWTASCCASCSARRSCAT